VVFDLIYMMKKKVVVFKGNWTYCFLDKTVFGGETKKIMGKWQDKPLQEKGLNK